MPYLSKIFQCVTGAMYRGGSRNGVQQFFDANVGNDEYPLFDRQAVRLLFGGHGKRKKTKQESCDPRTCQFMGDQRVRPMPHLFHVGALKRVPIYNQHQAILTAENFIILYTSNVLVCISKHHLRTFSLSAIPSRNAKPSCIIVQLSM